jgi:hypothetical protein
MGPPSPAHPHFNQHIPRPTEGASILVNYLETCLKHIQDAIVFSPPIFYYYYYYYYF